MTKKVMIKNAESFLQGMKFGAAAVVLTNILTPEMFKKFIDATNIEVKEK